MKFSKVFISLCLSILMAGSLQAQTFPDRHIRLVVPYTAGGTTDILLRLLQKPVSDLARQQVVIENRPGGASVIGTNAVAQAAPDGLSAQDFAYRVWVSEIMLQQVKRGWARKQLGSWGAGGQQARRDLPASLLPRAATATVTQTQVATVIPYFQR